MPSLGIILLAIAALVLLAAFGQALAALADRRKFPPPGRLIDVGTHRLHLHAAGHGSPTVILESGLASTSLSWAYVINEVAQFTRVCSYDRAGLGWSDPGPKPRTTSRIVSELHTLLQNAGIPPPYILVGHSFGAFTVRLYAGLYPNEVASIVLVDGLHPAEWHPANIRQLRGLSRAVRAARRGAWLAALGIPRFILFLAHIGGANFARKAALLASGGASRTAESLFLPVSKLPRNLLAFIFSFWTLPRTYHALADQLEVLPECAREVAATSNFGDLPFIALVAANSRPPRTMSADEVAGLSTRGQLITASESGHWIQIDQPALVLTTISQLVAKSRASESSANISRT